MIVSVSTVAFPLWNVSAENGIQNHTGNGQSISSYPRAHTTAFISER